MDMRKPVIGICRGIQFINVSLGGTLWQDLPTEHPSEISHRQGKPYDQVTHHVRLSGPLEELMGKPEMAVNSRSIIYVHYTGRLIDGTVFDTTEGDQLPALFMVGDLIMGWQIALTRMHEGDKWEVYIPAKWGYGATKMDDIPAHSTLIFTLHLVKIER